ncbi:TetR/AcrR family transcriptional regulator [Providencia rettgeri]|uniref:TetR/AcrR family transcriptional regulator n=1 Tax=Providencia rettgeri TaxID=587 RepID=UPI0034E0741D
MIKRKPGRPKAQQNSISPENIIAKAIAILDEKGIEQLSMRLIAKEMAITPMALYHYFADKNALIKAIGNTLYHDIHVSDITGIQPKIENLLLRYREKVIYYPQITLAIFSAPSLFPEHATRITEELIHLLNKLGLTKNQATQWAHILVDYTHGEALASSNLHHNERNIDKPSSENYINALKMLLNNAVSSLQP